MNEAKKMKYNCSCEKCGTYITIKHLESCQFCGGLVICRAMKPKPYLEPSLRQAEGDEGIREEGE